MNQTTRETIAFGAFAMSVIDRLKKERPKKYIEPAKYYAFMLAGCYEDEDDKNMQRQLDIIHRKIKYIEHMKGEQLREPVTALSALLDIAEQLRVKPGSKEDDLRNKLIAQLEGWMDYIVKNPAKYADRFKAAHDVTMKWSYS